MIDPAELERHRARLWGLCYRLTGVAADADELVQETFLRALEHPPADPARAALPWLLRVASNASLDLLRRRKTQAYVGAWLPAPIDEHAVDDEGLPPDAHYARAESLSYAFLIALEALSPTQRAVLLLRDVFGYAVEETSSLLGLSEANVKTSHHRARQALVPYESAREPASEGALARGREAMLRFVQEVAQGDLERVARLLAHDAASIQDGGGEFLAALRPLASRAHVARFFLGVGRMATPVSMVPVVLGGLPALQLEVQHQLQHHMPRAATRSVHLFEVSPNGEIARVYSLLARRKLAHLALP
jgi:RNA polymerase sigma factor (sigma-70 family)